MKIEIGDGLNEFMRAVEIIQAKFGDKVNYQEYLQHREEKKEEEDDDEDDFENSDYYFSDCDEECDDRDLDCETDECL